MKLLDQLSLVARRRGLAVTTQEAYCHWVGDYLRFSARKRGEWKRPEELGTDDVELYLNHLVGDRHLAASTQTLLGQSNLKTTMIYTHVMNKPAIAVRSPLDQLALV